MELGLSDNKRQTLANPIFDKSKGHRIPADDLYKFGSVGDIIRVFHNDFYQNVPVVNIIGNTRYIDVGDKYYVQEWDSKRWKEKGVEDKQDES